MLNPAIRILTVLCLLSVTSLAQAETVIITNPKNSSKDARFDYPQTLLREALDRTVDIYGPYKIQRYSEALSRNRALTKLVKGDLTVFEAPTRNEWEAAAIPVLVPVRKGILGYRLLFINKQDQALFSEVDTLEELLQYRMGQGSQWSTTQALKRLGIEPIGSVKYEPLFTMLKQKRFDYFPRGVNEIFGELEQRQEDFPDMIIEDSIALYLPLPTYFFVTPSKPEIAKRIEIGLLSMVDDGSLDRLFTEYHGPNIERAKLKERKVFSLENLNLSPKTPFEVKGFWYDPELD